MRSVEYTKLSNLPIFCLTACRSLCWPVGRPASAKSMAPDFSQHGLTMLNIQTAVTMMIYLLGHAFSFFPSLYFLIQKGIDKGVALSTITLLK